MLQKKKGENYSKKIIVALVLLHLIGPPARADTIIADNSD